MKTNKQRLQKFLALVALPLLISATALAQTFRGSINGTITDPSGAVVSGAKVTATEVATAVVRDTVSSGAGEFSFNDLPLGAYNVKVEATGFQTPRIYRRAGAGGQDLYAAGQAERRAAGDHHRSCGRQPFARHDNHHANHRPSTASRCRMCRSTAATSHSFSAPRRPLPATTTLAPSTARAATRSTTPSTAQTTTICT